MSEQPQRPPVTKDTTRIPQLRPPTFSKNVFWSVWLLIVFTTVCVTFVLPESYMGLARIRVERDATDIPGLTEVAPAPRYDPNFLRTELDVMKSDVILSKVIEIGDLKNVWARKHTDVRPLKPDESIKLLRAMLDLRLTTNSSLIEIGVISDRPEEAADLANAIGLTYRDHRKEQRIHRAQQSISVLEQRLKEQNDRIERQEEQIEDWSRRNAPAKVIENAQQALEEIKRFRQTLVLKVAGEQTDLHLPAEGMVEIVDKATPNYKTFRPNKPLNILLGMLLGGLGGLLLSAGIYAVKLIGFRRAVGLPTPKLSPRSMIHMILTLSVGLIVGFGCAKYHAPLSLIIILLTVLIGAGALALLELKDTGSTDNSRSA